MLGKQSKNLYLQGWDFNPPSLTSCIIKLQPILSAGSAIAHAEFNNALSRKAIKPGSKDIKR